MIRITCILILSLAVAVQSDKVLRVTFSTASETKEFQRYAQDNNLDIWSIRNNSADVAVSPAFEKEVKQLFTATELVHDVESTITEEMQVNEKIRRFSRRFRSSAAPIDYFAQYKDIVTWLSKLAGTHNFVSLRTIGKTFEGRDMTVVRIGSGPETKPAVFVMGGIHAREWLSSASTVYLIHKLVQGLLSGDARVKQLLSKYDFYVSPVSNPDGYEYSHINQGTRSWRKTRSQQYYGCFGADPNRNFDVEFGRKSASQDPCNLIYPGAYAFSEMCTKNLRDFALSPTIRGRIKLFYDVHAYSQMYFVPFAFDTHQKPSDDAELRRVASISNEALRNVNGRSFTLGTPGEILYEASGSTMDWFKLRAGVKYAYAFEVFPSMYSRIGFLARPSDIKPSGEEITEAIFTAAENIRI